jgi:hypothetical protein
MKTWVCNKFEGHWPVPVALVVTAKTVDDAILLVEEKLREINLPQKIKPIQLELYHTTTPNVVILSDGDY